MASYALEVKAPIWIPGHPVLSSESRLQSPLFCTLSPTPPKKNSRNVDLPTSKKCFLSSKIHILSHCNVCEMELCLAVIARGNLAPGEVRGDVHLPPQGHGVFTSVTSDRLVALGAPHMVEF